MIKPIATCLVLAICCVLALASQTTQSRPSQPDSKTNQSENRVVDQGIAVDLHVKAITDKKRNPDELREGDDAVFQLRFSDTTSGTPLRGIYPKAWMDVRARDENVDCRVKIKAFLSSGLQARPPVDFNSYYILALNQDATLSVIDPLFSYGGSKLFTLVSLKSAGIDWVLPPHSRLLFVSMPASRAVAVVNTDTWKVVANIDVNGRPSRVSVQPDGRKIWIGYDPSENGDESSGVAVVSADDFKRVNHIPTGRGHHEIAFTDDSRFAFITNSLDGNVSIIDVRTLKKTKDIKTGPEPVSIGFSTKANMAYVADQKDGGIVAIDPSGLTVAARIQGEPGLKQIKFVDDGRFAFVTNPVKDHVYIVDSASNRILQTADIGNGPEQVSFSSKLAYVRSLRSEIVVMLPIPESDALGNTVSVVDFPGGQYPFGKTTNPSPADGIVKAPGEDAVLVGNPMDKTIYYYREGMAAPQGNFSNYGREPRAVLVVDRSIREQSPGVYEVTARLPRAGLYEFALVTDTPRIAHCFPVRIAPNPDAVAESAGVAVEPLDAKRVVTVGEPLRLRFKLVDLKTHKSIAGLGDVGALIFSPGVGQQRHPAKEVEKGIYEVAVELSQAGVYYVYLGSASAGLNFDSPQSLVLQAKDKESP